jgi:hypothetical protein
VCFSCVLINCDGGMVRWCASAILATSNPMVLSRHGANVNLHVCHDRRTMVFFHFLFFRVSSVDPVSTIAQLLLPPSQLVSTAIMLLFIPLPCWPAPATSFSFFTLAFSVLSLRFVGFLCEVVNYAHGVLLWCGIGQPSMLINNLRRGMASDVVHPSPPVHLPMVVFRLLVPLPQHR